MSEDKIKARHSADVNAAMRIVKDARGDPDYFHDPAANAIFTEFLQTPQSTPLFAKEIIDKFGKLTDGEAYFPFRTENLTKVFPIKLFQFNGQDYYRKTELAAIARALFAETIKGSQPPYLKVLITKPSESLPGHEGEQLLHWKEAQTLFHRFDVIKCLDVTSSLKPARKKQRERDGKREGEGENVRNFRIQIQITYHVTSKMWNLSQLLKAIPPTDLLEMREPDHCVEVGGSAEHEGLYVDLPTFEHACCLLGVSPPPKFPESTTDPSTNQFHSVNSQKGDLVLADEKLLGTAVFERSSKTMHYGGTKYSEADAVQLFPPSTFKGLHRAILQSRYPPQSLKMLCQGQPTQASTKSLCETLTESLPDDPLHFTWRQHAHLKLDQEQPENPTEEWLEEQSKRRRRSVQIEAERDSE